MCENGSKIWKMVKKWAKMSQNCAKIGQNSSKMWQKFVKMMMKMNATDFSQKPPL